MGQHFFTLHLLLILRKLIDNGNCLMNRGKKITSLQASRGCKNLLDSFLYLEYWRKYIFYIDLILSNVRRLNLGAKFAG